MVRRLKSVICPSAICHLLICHFLSVCTAAEPSPGPLAPEAEMATFRVADPGISIELVAAEPEVQSPVAIAWDAAGALYVAEMIDYPVAPAAGQIRWLEDRDGDGRYERATVFAGGLAFPNGVLPCFGGVLVTAAPDILFLRDRDGDGRADERKVILTGFGEGNTQLRVNGLFWGLDNWIYAANGRSDGEVRAPNWPAGKTVSIRRRDVRFRFRPETDDVEVEAIAGFSQFGLAHNDWGHRFPSWNTIPIRHVVLEQSALVRNPFLAETSSVASILDEADGGRVYSISPVQTRFNRESVDYFNASCGPTIFRGDSLPPAYRGNAFVCEPLTNLVHRRVLESAGCTFHARRVEMQREFLASTDPAFRPVNLTTGPDGALYVVDMYREMVEHPDFVPAGLRKSVEFRRWHDRGRIWRVRSADAKKRAGIGVGQVVLSKASVDELVKDLNHPVGWWRDTAQRLLVERQDRKAVPMLQDQLRTAASPLGRLHALWTLSGLGALDAATLEQPARDSHPGVRENALRASAQVTAPAGRLPLPTVLKLAEDPSIRIRLQAALALGGHVGESQSALHALVLLGTHDAADPWMRLAIQSDLAETALPFLKEWIETYPQVLEAATREQLSFLSEIAAIVGVRRRDQELRSLLELVEPKGQSDRDRTRGLLGRLALLAGLGQGMDRSGPPLHAWLGDLDGQGRLKPDMLVPLWTAARDLALSNRPAGHRRIALEALVRGQPGLAGPIIARLLKPDQPAIVQSVAARAVGRMGDAELAARILDSWSELSLGTRREVCGSLLGSPAAAAVLVEAMESKKIAAVELDAASRDALLRLADVTLRKRAEAILARSAPADRSAVLARYQAALKLPGDSSRGALLFTKNCQTCHQLKGQGHRVGPDLSGIAGRLPAVLLNDILDPNRDVAADFVALTVATQRGQVLSGLLVEDTGSSLKLRKADGIDETVLRSETAEIRSSGRSLMPEGLEQALNLQEMADLLSFLRSSPQASK
jgi:putative membrane-bound dehydrogenase-like protein